VSHFAPLLHEEILQDDQHSIRHVPCGKILQSDHFSAEVGVFLVDKLGYYLYGPNGLYISKELLHLEKIISSALL
jgi:hypothetical protein